LNDAKDDIIDIWCPIYDTIFIRFKKRVDPSKMITLVDNLHADEVDPAGQDDLQYVKDGVATSKEITSYRNKINKYIRFWWD